MHVITARIIEITVIGGESGGSPKPKVRIASPNPPAAPRPIPPKRPPIPIHISTIAN
ncbi:hypothetical protein TUM12147_11470 [Citrobacter europaeus]|nr:hypothetical protein TUM12147_11470 [Citrobacter europaeus]GIZ23492.1 hypothetical protein TUM12148_21560 [Citrobacter europaeus]